MLTLDDPRWSSLRQAYGPALGVPALLRRLDAAPDDEAALDELLGQVQHQGTVYAASFAALPHLVALTPRLAPFPRLRALTVAADVVAAKSPPVPDVADIRSGVAASRAPLRAQILGELQREDLEEVGLRYLLAAWAAVAGHPRLANALQGLDDLLCRECGADLTE